MVISISVYLAILAALALERIFELWISKRNARRALAAGAIESEYDHYGLLVAFHGVNWCEPLRLDSDQAGDWTICWVYNSSNRTGER
jgi:hypothetical protein